MSQKKKQELLTNSHIAFLTLIIVAIIGGGGPTFSKLGLEEIPPLTFIFLRFIIGLLVLTPIAIKRGLKLNKDILKLALISLFATANIIGFTFGVRRTTAISSQIIYTSVPIISAIFSYLLIKEKITYKKIIGIFIGLLGTSSIVILPVLDQASNFSGDLIGNILIFSGATSFTIYTVLSKRLQKEFSPLFLTFVFLFTTAMVIAPLAFVESNAQLNWWQNLTYIGVIGLLFVGLMNTATYYLLYQYVIKRGSPVIASMAFYLQPITGYIWASIILGERITTIFAIGAILALTGAWITTQSKERQSEN